MVDTPEAGAPQPKPTGSDSQTQQNGSAEAITPETVKSLIQESNAEFRQSLGLQDGQRIDHMIHGVTRKVFGIPDGKSATEHLTETMVEALKEVKTPAAPKGEEASESAQLLQTISSLEGTVKSLVDENKDVKVQNQEVNRVTKVDSLVDNLGIDQKLVSSFKKMASNGLLDGIPKPYAHSESGDLVVDSSNGPVAFGTVLSSYLETNDHWLGEHKAGGTGARGNSSAAGNAQLFDFKESGRALASAYETAAQQDPSKALSTLAENNAKKAARLGMPQ